MNRDKEERPLRSGALATRTGVSADTLRFYEQRGLLPAPPRDASGYRRYPPAAVTRVRVIQRALDAGFTVDELARVFKQRDNGGAPCREVFAIASARLTDLEQRIADLSDLRDELRATLAAWQHQLEATPSGQRAHLLDGFGESERPAEAERSTRRRERAQRVHAPTVKTRHASIRRIVR